MWKVLTFLLAAVILAAGVAWWSGHDPRTWHFAPPNVTTPPPVDDRSEALPPETARGEAAASPEGLRQPTTSPERSQQPSDPERPHEEDDPAAIWTAGAERVRESLDREDLQEAEQRLAELDRLDPDPTAEQTTEAAALRTRLEQLGVRVQLRAAVGRLNDDQETLRAAENLLFERADEALPLLAKALESAEPAPAGRVMAVLRRMDRPEATLPMIVGVLGRAEQSACWAEAVRQIEMAEAAGAGEPLLDLVLRAQSPAQRSAALDALSRCADPPPRTIAALLPLLYADTPELAAALRAARRAAVVHASGAPWMGQGAASALEAPQSEQLFGLGDRLQSIAVAEEATVSDEAKQAARELAVALRLAAATPLEGVSVLAFGAESPDGRAANVLDGTWDTTDPPRMWRYPAKEPHSIVFDLGTERTVVGVRIWNLNHPQQTSGGWKDVVVSVGSSPAELSRATAVGVVPPAPGAAGAADFGTTISVDFRTGRYVRLRCTALHGGSGEAGLTEVQVLGF